MTSREREDKAVSRGERLMDLYDKSGPPVGRYFPKNVKPYRDFIARCIEAGLSADKEIERQGKKYLSAFELLEAGADRPPIRFEENRT